MEETTLPTLQEGEDTRQCNPREWGYRIGVVGGTLDSKELAFPL